MAEPGPIDFVPGACEAANISECFLNSVCRFDEEGFNDASFEGIAPGFDAETGNLVDFQAEINEVDDCIIAAVAQAFISAGCPLPESWPPTTSFSPTPPDFTDCIDDLTDMGNEAVGLATDPLGALGSVFTLTYDPPGDFLEGDIVRIQV